jgi:hypothetical protein
MNWDLTGARPTDPLAFPVSQRLSHYPVGDLWYDARIDAAATIARAGWLLPQLIVGYAAHAGCRSM